MTTEERRRRSFSTSFKIKKVKEIEQGKSTVSEANREYQVTTTNVYRWINKFGSMKNKTERVIVETDSDTKMLLEYKQKVAELENIIGQKQILLDFKDKMIDLAEEIYGVDIKKNFFRAVEYIWFHRENFHFKMNALYRALGTSKQSFHQKLNRLYMLRSEQEQLFIMIHQLREEHPTMGMRDMYFKLAPECMR